MNSVKVYTTTRCPYCVMLKNYLASQNIAFEEVNLERKPEYIQKLMQTTGQMGVPQTEINGKWVIGYDPETITSFLN
ncbi:glutaredoxin family protein [Bacillus sp. HMF5848]|uniref:glutaredoxin family protein n=1 Tax=Bacillus sp. HMF5848 TaxID=2495421 RepID=UPI000F786643|nr:glutaredoxin domain-containing protein [Bacillus sp. HMF5848]RSK28330.1 glutaredoxin family protein [Bacillus sp. HMF5848]